MEPKDTFKDTLKFKLAVATEQMYLCIRFYTLGSTNNITNGFVAFTLNTETINLLINQIKAVSKIISEHPDLSICSITSFSTKYALVQWFSENSSIYHNLKENLDGISVVPESQLNMASQEIIKGVTLHTGHQRLFWSGYEKYSEVSVETETIFLDMLEDIMECLKG